MNSSTSTPHGTITTRLAAAALGVAVVSSLAVASAPASAKRADPNEGMGTTTVIYTTSSDPGDALAHRKSRMPAVWWASLWNVH